MSMHGAPETAPVTRADAQWIGLVASTTGFVTWAVGTLVFRGEIPAEVYGFIQCGVPFAMAGVAAEWRWRVARRR